MRLVLLSLAASAALATPALANEARVEARGGVIWDSGTTEATAGVALGYDWDLGSSTFVGVEAAADKILASGYRVAFGFGGRAGIKASADDRLFVAGGYSTAPCSGCEDSIYAGAGYEHNFGPMYGKVEYRHFFVDNGFSDSDAVVAGVGMRF